LCRWGVCGRWRRSRQSTLLPMNLADVFTVLFVVLGLMVVFVAYWLLAAGLFPNVVRRCAERVGASLGKVVLVGTVGLVPVIVVGIYISKIASNPLGKIFGVLVVFGGILLALLGAAGIATRIGQGLASVNDEREPWRRVLRGGVVLALALGTVVLLPVMLLAGFGALLLGWKGSAVVATEVRPVGFGAGAAQG